MPAFLEEARAERDAPPRDLEDLDPARVLGLSLRFVLPPNTPPPGFTPLGSETAIRN